MEEKARETGIEIVGDVPWGTHFCQFYQTKDDLIDVLVPYFEAGLKNNEFCMWVTSEPLNVEDAKKALKKKVKGLDNYITKGQMEILDYSQWYTKSGGFNSDRVLQGWIRKEKQALEEGFDGLRLTGNTLWLEEKDWKAFTDYEAAINSIIGQHRMLAVCTYCLDKCRGSEIVDVVSNHQFALIKRKGKWEIIESSERKKTAEAMQESEEKYHAIFEQAADSIVLIDAENGELVEFNERAHESLGYTLDEFQRLKIPDFDVIESSEQVAKHIVRIVGQGADVFETKHRTKNGEIRDILVSSRAISIGGRDFVQSIWQDITERKRAEEALQRSEGELTIRNRIADIFLTIPDDEIYGEVLQVLLEAMESRYGILGYIDADGALVCPSMTRDIWKQCQVPDKTIVFPREKWDGIWGRALIEKKTLYANEGLHVPEGHVPITKVLVVPIKYADQVIGLLEVANKSTDYSHEDQEFLETIAGKIAPILNARLQRDIAEADLRKYRQHLEELVQDRTAELTEANKRLLQEIEQRKQLERALLDVSEREQRRIGQELHDSIGQQFTGIAFMTKVLEQKLATKLPEEAASVEEIGKLVNQAMDQTRGLVKVLEPVTLDAGSLMLALQELSTTTEHLFGIRCTFKCDKPVPIDDAEAAVNLYRITQEAVTNAIKHGRAKNIHIGLTCGEKESVLTVESDGAEFPKEFEKRGTGMGLQIMDHRADIIGGSLNIRSRPKGGTIVTCEFPGKKRSQ